MKNIVVCSDGTGNTAIKGRGTNVFKLFEAVDLAGHRADITLIPQIALYDDGVGTEDFKPLRIFAGMTGYGLSRNVKQLYKEIVRVYDPGDRLYFFGFSRGAFTVRSLVGFIVTCGLLDPAKLTTAGMLDAKVKEAYGVYRKCYRTWLAQLFLGKPEADLSKPFRDAWARREAVPIRFIGVWDTVDAVGMPFHLSDVLNTLVYRFKFPDRHLSKQVECARHALAIDDERHSFHPLLWNEVGERDGARIEQVWFSGAHSNVGGGYPKQGMSLVALDWMMSEAEHAGLRFHVEDQEFYRQHANVDDKLYDPRAGLGIFYRWKPRDIGPICERNGVQPRLHASVLERVAHGTDDYAPGNLPPDAAVVCTPPGPDESAELLGRRAANMRRVLQDEHNGGGALITRVGGALVVGWLSYYVYLIACTLGLLAGAGDEGLGGILHPLVLVPNVARMTFGLVTAPIATGMAVARRIWASPAATVLLLGGLALSYAMALAADSKMSRVFSGFWHAAQPKLREALKTAREIVTGKAA